MSCNRENVIWKCEDGTFSRGFFRVIYPSYIPDDWDYEWDVEYDYSEFFWFKKGLASVEDAWNAWKGANPSSYRYYEYDSDPEAVAELEGIAAAFIARWKVVR